MDEDAPLIDAPLDDAHLAEAYPHGGSVSSGSVLCSFHCSFLLIRHTWISVYGETLALRSLTPARYLAHALPLH